MGYHGVLLNPLQRRLWKGCVMVFLKHSYTTARALDVRTLIILMGNNSKQVKYQSSSI